MKASDIQVGGNHYQKYEYQPAQFCEDIEISFLLSSAIKYIVRYPNKNSDDIQKAIHCLRLYVEYKGANEAIYVKYSGNYTYTRITATKRFLAQFEGNKREVLTELLGIFDKNTGVYKELSYKMDKLIKKLQRYEGKL